MSASPLSGENPQEVVKCPKRALAFLMELAFRTTVKGGNFGSKHGDQQRMEKMHAQADGRFILTTGAGQIQAKGFFTRWKRV